MKMYLKELKHKLFKEKTTSLIDSIENSSDRIPIAHGIVQLDFIHNLI